MAIPNKHIVEQALANYIARCKSNAEMPAIFTGEKAKRARLLEAARLAQESLDYLRQPEAFT